ncbi:MAG: hypothetical protein V2A74_06795, partial [bacterium]
HGGDPTANEIVGAHDLKKGFVGVPSPEEITEICGHCHRDAEFMRTQNPSLATDQYDKYWTSRHGQLLRMGLRKVAQCASCHTAHDIRPASDPLSSVYPVNLPKTCAHCHSDREYMAGFPIPNDQYEKFATSVHGKALLEKEDLGAPACNDCHGNHGAVPPGAESLAHVCGICHSLNAELFEKSPHAKAFAVQELPQCVVCHHHHAIAPINENMFDMQANSVCINCHRQGDPGWQEGKQMFTAIDKLNTLHQRAEGDLNQAQTLGMDVSDGRFALQDFRKDMMQIRTISHSFDRKAFADKTQEARNHVTTALEVASNAVQEFHFRRRGHLISFILSIPVIFFLALKIRQLDRGREKQRR